MKVRKIGHALGLSGDARRTFEMFLAISLMVPEALPQQETPYQAQRSAQDSTGVRRPELSEFAQDNYKHVAASVLDIKAVLLGNPGLMLELKTLIAREVSENGQIINED